MKRVFFSLLILVSLQVSIRGQDKIITIQHDTIHCRILSVSSINIHYEQKAENGFVSGKFIPTEQVLEFIRAPQSGEYNQHNWARKQKPKPKHRWMLGIHPGSSFLLTSTIKDKNAMIYAGIPKSQVDNYVKQLRHGWNFGVDAYYMLFDIFGLGAKYSLFASSAQQPYMSIHFGHEFEKIYIHYVAPSVIFRQWLDKNSKFQLIETFSAGYVHYRNKMKYDSSSYFSSSLNDTKTWGANASLSADYFHLPWLSVGVNANFMYALIKMRSYYSIQQDEPINLSRLDYSLSIRFYF